MSHYYYYDKKTKSNEKEISSTVNNNKYLFITDNGVFSKNKIDFGTRLLLNEIDIDGPRKIVDYGCGYGVIGIVLKKNIQKHNFSLWIRIVGQLSLQKKMS